jgi:Dihydroorotase and related cyclic amidohydrolases
MTEELDLLIEGKIYSNGEIVEAYLGVVDGKVAGIWISGTFKYREKRALESKEVALPGMMDIHVHMRGLEQSYKEDWFSGTEAALRGGVTAILDMPNNKPWIRDENTLMRKMESKKTWH